jgi:hypothetical protein
VIHAAPVETSHAHSGCVVTENLPAPPAESITGGVVSETWHLTTSGLVSEIEEDVPQPLMNTAAHRRMATTADGA